MKKFGFAFCGFGSEIQKSWVLGHKLSHWIECLGLKRRSKDEWDGSAGADVEA